MKSQAIEDLMLMAVSGFLVVSSFVAGYAYRLLTCPCDAL